MYRININMRCIEIKGWQKSAGVVQWLTLTWDVLKF